MNAKLNWGILSTGWIATRFVRDLRLTGHPVVAVGSRSAENARAFAAEFSIPHVHGSYEALVADADVDVVYVATPHPFHMDNALLALGAGKHVLIEKPISLNAREARRIRDVAAERDLVVLEAMWTRYLPHMKRIRELVASGALGELRAVTADLGQELPDDPAHRINSIELGGGALLDLGIYPVSLISDLLGTPANIHAWARFKKTGVDAEVTTVFDYSGGTVAMTRSVIDRAGPNKASIFGSEAWIDIEPLWFQPTPFRVYSNRDGRQLELFDQPVEGRGMQLQAAEVERLVASGDRAVRRKPMENSVAVMELLDAVREKIGLRYPRERGNL